MMYTYKKIREVVSMLKSMRTISSVDSVEFRKQYSAAIMVGKRLYGNEFEITIPRLSSSLSNHLSTTPDECYKVSLYEFLSHVLAELEEKFLNNFNETVIGLLISYPVSVSMQM